MQKRQQQERESQGERRLARHIESSMEVIRGDFSSSKTDHDYTMRLENSMSRFSKRRIDNLFAIILPAGTGKTYLAKKYGFIDVDKCVTYNEHVLLYHERKKILEGERRWADHNESWNSKVRGTLEMLDYSRPVVILCHSEEMAFEIGATPMIAVLLREDAWRENIKDRTKLGKQFSELNRMTVEKHTRKVQVCRAKSNDIVEKLVIRACNAYGLPVACPNKYTTESNPHYGLSCPEWVMTGDVSKMDVNVLLSLVDDDEIPKECADYFFRSQNMPASFGYGQSIGDWAEWMAKVRYASNDARDLDLTKDWMELFPYANDREKNRMNVGLKRIMENTNLINDEEILDILRHHVGENHQFVTMLVCYWAGIGRFLPEADLLRPMMKVNFTWWKVVMKEFHSLVRINDYVMNTKIESEEHRQSMMYLDCLLGRRIFIADEDAEIKDGTGSSGGMTHMSYDPVVRRWSVEQYRKDFMFALENLHIGMIEKPKDPGIESFSQFYARREEWMTKGSLVSNTIPREYLEYTVKIVDDVNNVVQEVTKRHNKRSLFECYDAINLMTDKFELFNVTKAVEKLNENGHKDRVLLPGGLLHYIVFAYVLRCAEAQEQLGSLRLNAPPDDEMRYIDVKMHAGLSKLLYDWANFNVQHSSEELATVISFLGKVVQSGNDYKEFCDLIADAMFNMVLKKRDGTLVKLDKGLYSGWRGTTWDNTVLNGCYMGVAKLCFVRLYKYDCALFADQGGDDVDQEFAQPEDAYRMLAVLDRMGFEATKSKQMIGRNSEFFRVTITRTGAYASPVRGLATFVAGNWEGTGNVSVKERVVSLVDMAWKLIRRGVDAAFMITLTEVAITHWAKIRKDLDWMKTPQEVIHGAEECGGMGIPDKDGMVWIVEPPIPDPENTMEVSVPGKLAAMDYVAVLDRELRSNNISIEKWEMVAEKMAEGAFDVYKDGAFEVLLEYKGNVVEKKPVVVPKWDEMAFRVLMEFEGSKKTVAKQMSKLERYESVLPYLSVEGREVGKKAILEAMGITGNMDVLDFKGDVYYRRLVGEPFGRLVTNFCKTGLFLDELGKEQAEDLFRTLCYMGSKLFDHHI
ncbi:RNA-dependent RNA polymerase [Helminthosporium victoriae virus 145S]|uniref:RNA-directed RNA polymerase n=1 Tax=Helminthosporium victoriae virus 145S TaxID=2560520 RepID=Q8JVB7_9VIRU|nr:RNA-dependent RNA polymerase [Helminthosporium victoriae virus 145S]AAM68953.1 RNA-dependent RNA polymerase [Helminthosporium victoriae virus 145S]